MYTFNRTNLVQINPAISGHPGIFVQSLSSLSSITPQPDCLENISDLYVH